MSTLVFDLTGLGGVRGLGKTVGLLGFSGLLNPTRMDSKLVLQYLSSVSSYMSHWDNVFLVFQCYFFMDLLLDREGNIFDLDLALTIFCNDSKNPNHKPRFVWINAIQKDPSYSALPTSKFSVEGGAKVRLFFSLHPGKRMMNSTIHNGMKHSVSSLRNINPSGDVTLLLSELSAFLFSHKVFFYFCGDFENISIHWRN